MLFWRIRFPRLIFGLFCLAVASCTPLMPPATESPSRILDIEPTPSGEGLQVEVSWTYQDEYRLAVEISIEHYPIPQGFQTRCPLTQLGIKNVGETLFLYRNPEQVNLDEFYTFAQNNRWYCMVTRTGNGFADYVFSLSHFYGDKPAPDFGKDAAFVLELGEVMATNSVSMMTLPAVGIFDFPLEIKPAEKNLTWLNLGKIEGKGMVAQIQRVAVNPTFTLLDACLEYLDHHFWKPRAKLTYQGHEAYSTEWLSTFPPQPADRDTILQSTRRCYSLYIPFFFPIDTGASFRIGIDQVTIDNTDSGVMTMKDCENVKKKMEESYPGLKIRCYEFEMRHQPQHWFEVLSYPSEMSALEGYTLVESAFRQTIAGPWEVEIQVEEDV